LILGSRKATGKGAALRAEPVLAGLALDGITDKNSCLLVYKPSHLQHAPLTLPPPGAGSPILKVLPEARFCFRSGSPGQAQGTKQTKSVPFTA
ncbi:MAG TPA: hypothetical protein VFX43_12795, partial [Chitinophagaceae bacterium]|nr:hypothetical protein [Chitinophagaceae bacterium]